MMTDILQQWGAAATEYMLYPGFPQKNFVFRLLLPQPIMVSANIVHQMCVGHIPHGCCEFSGFVYIYILYVWNVLKYIVILLG